MMTNAFNGPVRDASLVTLSLLAWNFGALPADANPTGGAVAHGSATFNASGSQFTITTATASTLINWQTFNIGAGETTTFVEPTSSSVVWNHINDLNPSQILGSINANGYVVLQNQNGFVVGGNAAIKAAGLVMTTSPTPAPNLSSGGAWEFDSPPPASKIINYGQITVAGGPVYLIADDIENNGTISAPEGKIGLYAGKEVLVSTSPTGRGLSAKVTLPQGSVDNEGKLIADGGTIAALAQAVNQNGTVQANSVQNVNGVIDLVAGDSLNLGADSTISAQGAATGVSAGGSVTLQSGGAFFDQAGSTISMAGGAKGGNGGQLEISSPNLGALQSHIDGQATAGFQGGKMVIDPTDVTLDANAVNSYNQMIAGGLSQLTISASDNITLDTVWNLADAAVPSALTLSAGNSIILNDGSVTSAGISGGKNWTLSLIAGTAFVSSPGQPTPAAGTEGVYLNAGAYVQTQDGNINVSAANEVIIQNVDLSTGALGGAIRTMAGGNINVTAQYGDVNAGNDVKGYDFGLKTAPYYRVDPNLGGISTAAGGNVTINAGGDVISYLPTQYDYNNYGSVGDAGTGAFGPEPGNVSITAGGSVYGNYVVANGTGSINADANAGLPVSLSSESADFALSLIKGNWSVYAQNIYLDDVINPNGVFNDATTGKGKAGAHNFDYDANASLLLDAANAVEFTGAEVPLTPASDPTTYQMPVLLPPSLAIVAGAGGLTLDTDVILFPSANGNLNITTSNGGGFVSRENPSAPADFNVYSLVMSDSGQTQFATAGYGLLATETFGIGDHAATPAEVGNPNPVMVNISGSMNDVNLYTAKQTDLTVGVNMFNSSLVGRNLTSSDVTSVNVTGSITYSPIYAFTTLSQALANGWDSIFSELVDGNPSDPNYIGNVAIPATDLGNERTLQSLATGALAFPNSTHNPGFVYNVGTQQLGYAFQMTDYVRSIMEGTLTVIKLDSSGNPEIQPGQASLGQNPSQYYFVTTTVNFFPASVIETLYNNSQVSVANAQTLAPGFQIGGPGQFTLKAGSMDLGASGGIVSWGSADGAQSLGGINYASLGSLTDNAGASVNVTVAGDLDMLTSTIASINGGTVTVDSTDGAINLGLAGLALSPPNAGNLAYGIYAAGAGDVSVTANGSINIDTARIATFNGGDVTVVSNHGDVNAGDGANMDLLVPYYFYDSKTGLGNNGTIQGPRPYGSGILAISPTEQYQVSPGTAKGGAELPGNITVETPNGNIVSTLGGIAQFALNGNVASGPAIDLTAGTVGVKATTSQGNIDLGQGGVIGGSVNLSAQGNISGLIVSRQGTTLNAVENINVTVLSVGPTVVAAGGDIKGTLVSVGGLSASGQNISATMLSSSVSANGGASQNSLGTATASAASQSAANQSNNETKQEVANNTGTDDDQNKKKSQSLLQRVKRVTVILPKT